jgi:hypothetical protein
VTRTAEKVRGLFSRPLHGLQRLSASDPSSELLGYYHSSALRTDQLYCYLVIRQSPHHFTGWWCLLCFTLWRASASSIEWLCVSFRSFFAMATSRW